MSHLTTHVLDASLGSPAAGIAVVLHDADGLLVARGVTDDDGRIGSLGPDLLPAGAYRLAFDTAPYFADRGVPTFYPRVTIDFTVGDAPHYHVPVLLSPFAYSTYRGS
jgi:5-hydroxyisourate hydrolase